MNFKENKNPFTDMNPLKKAAALLLALLIIIFYVLSFQFLIS